MKKVLVAMGICFFMQASSLHAQNSTASPEAQVVLANNETVSGAVTDNIRKKGELIMLINGKKTKFKAGDITSVRIGASNYITSNYTFYEVIHKGKNLTLLRKASEPSGLQYNGSDAVVVTSQGDIDDLFIKKENNTPQLLTKKNAKEILGDCAAGVETGKFDVDAVKKAVEGCDI